MLEERMAEWRSWLARRPAIAGADIEELEDHLRTQVGELEAAGLAEDEAFLVAVKRLGDLDALSREFAEEYSERLWKQLVARPEAGTLASENRREAWIVVALATAAAAAVKLPELFGRSLTGGDESFYARNLALLVLPFLAAFFARRRGLDRVSVAWIGGLFAAGAAFVNVFPFAPGSHTEVLAALHLPIALWLTVGVAYAAGRWRDPAWRMNFVRFSGEWFVYYALIALGGGVLTAFTLFVFETIGLDAGRFVGSWLLPCGAAGAVVIAAWLVEAKQSVVENMAPVLARLFTPLFTLLLLVFLGTVVATGNPLDVGRELLIGFDLLLVLVLGLLLYAISARDPRTPAGPFDALQLGLVVAALAVDALALWAIASRISAFGWSPNKVAALGENLVLLVNLAGAAWLYARFLRGRVPFAELERWQTAYLPVFAAWVWIVVALFPPLFGFR